MSVKTDSSINVEKIAEEATTETPAAAEPTEPVKRGRGRPRKVVDPNAPVKPKRKCSEKQLAALAAGRAKNSRFHPKKE